MHHLANRKGAEFGTFLDHPVILRKPVIKSRMPTWSISSLTVMYCTDPGEVDHSTRLISDPVLLVGTTIQYTCNPGFVLEGSSLLTCYSRETGTPIWTSRLPHCVCECCLLI